MAAHLAYTSLPAGSAPIHELDQVVVRTDVEGDEGEAVREGSCGTVLSVLGNGAAYLVEFGGQSVSDAGYPIPVLATIELAKLTPMPGTAHADLRPGAPESFTIGTLKISAYLLNPSHPSGGSKARYFISYGFDPSAPDLLAAALLAYPTRPTSVTHPPKVTAYDVRYTFEGPLDAPRGPTGRVRSVWQILPSESVARLITA